MQNKENEILKQMLDWLYANTDAHNQVGVARRSGVNAVTLSKALNGKIKKVKQETLRKVNAGFDNVFNPAWLRGDSDVMLVADLQPDDRTAPIVTMPAKSPNEYIPTTNSLINAALAAKDETIMTQKRELDNKDATIALLREQLIERTTLMQSIQQQSADLSAKYEALLQEHSKLLHRINVKIDTINGSYLSIAAESESDYRLPKNKKRTPKD